MLRGGLSAVSAVSKDCVPSGFAIPLVLLGCLVLVRTPAIANVSRDTRSTASPSHIVLIDSNNRTNDIETISEKLELLNLSVDLPLAQLKDWPKQATIIGKTKPAVVVIHLHSLRPSGVVSNHVARYDAWEDGLLSGLGHLEVESSLTRYVIWSRSFEAINGNSGQVRLKGSLVRLSKRYPDLAPAFGQVLARSQLLYWPHPPGPENVEDLRIMVRSAAKEVNDSAQPNRSQPPSAPQDGQSSLGNQAARSAEPASIWTFLKKKKNRDTLVMLGGALAMLCTGAWALYLFWVGRRDRAQAAAGPTANSSAEERAFPIASDPETGEYIVSGEDKFDS
jgi:hypothetical protein